MAGTTRVDSDSDLGCKVVNRLVARRREVEEGGCGSTARPTGVVGLVIVPLEVVNREPKRLGKVGAGYTMRWTAQERRAKHDLLQ